MNFFKATIWKSPPAEKSRPRFASFTPATVALRAAFGRLPSKRPLACVQQFPSCLMYAGFKRIAPEQDTGMDLNEPWIIALGLLNAGKSS